MPLSTLERDVYDALGVLSIANWALLGLHIKTPQFFAPGSDKPTVLDARTASEIGDLWWLVDRAEQRLIGTNQRREMWASAAQHLDYSEADSFDAMFTGIMAGACSGFQYPFYANKVIRALRAIAVFSPPAEFAEWRRLNPHTEAGFERLLGNRRSHEDEW